jgi:hypothetical protein
LVPQFAHCDTISENNYCFTFYDERQQLIDTVPAIYNWDFGDGKLRKGKEVKYCFPGPGQYTVKLTIIDAIEGKAIADKVEYKVNLEDVEQALINSDNIGVVNQPVLFQGITTGLTDFTAKAYFWNFGDGFRPGGSLENKIFGKKGEYTVQLGLWGQKDSLGILPEKCYLKNVRIFNSYEELALPEQHDGKFKISAFLMDDLSENQKQNIRKIFNKTGNSDLDITQGIIYEADSPLLDKIAGLISVDPEVKLEMVAIQAEGIQNDPNATEKLKQQLAFYFRNKALNGNSIHCSTSNLTVSAFKTDQIKNKSGEMIVEFIFMKNNAPMHD